MSDSLNTFMNDLKKNVAGFIAVAVTDIKTGVSHCSLSVDPSFDPKKASSYNIQVIKSKVAAVKALGSTQKIDDVLIMLPSHVHIIDVSANGEYFVYLAVDSLKANLGSTRVLLKKYSKDIASKL
ncbi:MAG: hypothetical protein H7221_05115 [Flavobacterium sp.]|nr:hypothetical protein [Flavobacterium sp.]